VVLSTALLLAAPSALAEIQHLAPLQRVPYEMIGQPLKVILKWDFCVEQVRDEPSPRPLALPRRVQRDGRG
jgi:hypothetical protein